MLIYDCYLNEKTIPRKFRCPVGVIKYDSAIIYSTSSCKTLELLIIYERQVAYGLRKELIAHC